MIKEIKHLTKLKRESMRAQSIRSVKFTRDRKEMTMSRKPSRTNETRGWYRRLRVDRVSRGSWNTEASTERLRRVLITPFIRLRSPRVKSSRYLERMFVVERRGGRVKPSTRSIVLPNLILADTDKRKTTVSLPRTERATDFEPSFRFKVAH